MVGWALPYALDTNFTLTYHYEHLPSLHEGHVDNHMMLILHETYAPVLQEPKTEGRITKTCFPSNRFHFATIFFSCLTENPGPERSEVWKQWYLDAVEAQVYNFISYSLAP